MVVVVIAGWGVESVVFWMSLEARERIRRVDAIGGWVIELYSGGYDWLVWID